MTKIKAVLDQETWVEVDVPDEFQAIVTSLFTSEALASGSPDDAQDNMTINYSGGARDSDSTTVPDGIPQNAHQTELTGSREVISEETTQVKSTLSEANERNSPDATTSSAQSSNKKEGGRSTSQTLTYEGVSYHMVNWLVVLFCFSFSMNWSVIATVFLTTV